MFEYSFWSLRPALQESELKLPLGASKAPKIANVANFWTCFAIFRCLRGPLVAQLLQILVEEVIIFEMSTQTSKSDKNWLQYWRKSDYSLFGGIGFLPLVNRDHAVTLVYTVLAAASSIQGRERVRGARYTYTSVAGTNRWQFKTLLVYVIAKAGTIIKKTKQTNVLTSWKCIW